MNVQTEAVAEAVAEVFTEARFRDDRAGSAVNLTAGDSGSAGGDAGQLRLQDGVIDLLHLVRRLTERDGARHVAAVSVLQAAEVHGDEVPRLKHSIPRNAVGLAGVLAGDDDGVKGIALAAKAEHAVDQLGGDFLLGHAGADDLQGLFQGLLADPLGGDHAAQLFFVLRGAKLFHERPGGLKAQAEQVLEIRILGVAELPVLGGERRELLLRKDPAEQTHLGVRVVIEQHLGAAAGRRFGRFDVAGVGDQPGLFPGDQDKAVREGKARGIALVLLVGQQKGVEPQGVEFFLNLQNVVHIPVSSDVGRGKLTMKTEPCGLLFPTRMLPP